MNTAFHPSYGPSGSDVRRVNRMIAWSVGIHLGALLVVAVLPRSWFGASEPPHVMTISLGGTPGPRSTGQTSIGGRTVEEVAPPPPRPEPPPPTPPPSEPEPAAAVVRTPTPPSVSTPAPRPAPATTRRATTGPQVATGTSRADTGARGQGAGLSFGGGGLGGETDVTDFCCEWYLRTMLSTIEGNWRRSTTERGTTTLRFEIRRDGSIGGINVERSSGSGPLDRAARAALIDTRLPPLPGEYTEDALIIHLHFENGLP